MIRVFKLLVYRFSTFYFNVGRHYKPVDDIILIVLCIFVIWRIQKTASGIGIVKNKAPTFGQHVFVKSSRIPHAVIEKRIFFFINAGECLVEIPSGNNVVALCVLFFYYAQQYFCLSFFAFSVVVSLQMQVDQNKLLVGALYIYFFNKKAPFQVAGAHGPLKRHGQRLP